MERDTAYTHTHTPTDRHPDTHTHTHTERHTHVTLTTQGHDKVLSVQGLGYHHSNKRGEYCFDILRHDENIVVQDMSIMSFSFIENKHDLYKTMASLRFGEKLSTTPSLITLSYAIFSISLQY